MIKKRKQLKINIKHKIYNMHVIYNKLEIIYLYTI